MKSQPLLTGVCKKKAEEEIWKGVREIDKRQGFKGPLASLESEESIFAKLEGQRREMYKDASLFFIFLPDGSVEPELEYEEGELEWVLEYERLEREQLKSRWKSYFEVGLHPEDDFQRFIEVGKNYEAVVTRVSNSQRMIYVSVAGVKGMIPYRGFRWAHERKITEERHYWS